MGLRVGRDISIVGLDDSLRSQLHQITCYNFNLRKIADAAVSFVLLPPEVRRKGPAVVEIEGSVVERSSVASVYQPAKQ
jgi:DNA-binding LacI/PurR family transcriptional regulator